MLSPVTTWGAAILVLAATVVEEAQATADKVKIIHHKVGWACSEHAGGAATTCRDTVGKALVEQAKAYPADIVAAIQLQETDLDMPMSLACYGLEDTNKKAYTQVDGICDKGDTVTLAFKPAWKVMAHSGGCLDKTGLDTNGKPHAFAVALVTLGDKKIGSCQNLCVVLINAANDITNGKTTIENTCGSAQTKCTVMLGDWGTPWEPSGNKVGVKKLWGKLLDGSANAISGVPSPATDKLTCCYGQDNVAFDHVATNFDHTQKEEVTTLDYLGKDQKPTNEHKPIKVELTVKNARRLSEEISGVQARELLKTSTKKIVQDSDYKFVGCYYESSPRKLPVFLKGYSKGDKISVCAQLAYDHYYTHFAIQNDDTCYAGADAATAYDDYGPATTCKKTGALWASSVYKLDTPRDPYLSSTKLESGFVDCYYDKDSKVLPTKITEYRSNCKVSECRKLAHAKSLTYYGIRNKNECWAGKKLVSAEAGTCEIVSDVYKGTGDSTSVYQIIAAGDKSKARLLEQEGDARTKKMGRLFSVSSAEQPSAPRASGAAGSLASGVAPWLCLAALAVAVPSALARSYRRGVSGEGNIVWSELATLAESGESELRGGRSSGAGQATALLGASPATDPSAVAARLP